MEYHIKSIRAPRVACSGYPPFKMLPCFISHNITNIILQTSIKFYYYLTMLHIVTYGTLPITAFIKFC